MVFSSLLFLFRFLPLVLLLYYISPKKMRNFILFAVSLLFYAWGEPVYIVIMLFSTVVDYVHGRLVDSFLNHGKRKKAKLAVISSMVINLSLLGFFKYYDFIAESINGVFHTGIPILELALPIGISFYTFQTMSYTIDVYRGQAKMQKNIISFGAYVAMFPQLIAGPIVQYKTIAKELDSRNENTTDFSDGISQFMIGLGKKVLLANNIGLLWDTVKAMPISEISVITAWLGIFAFAFQIYFDFSGYSDMAIGLGKMFGFHFPLNFNYPYMSKSITEFWRRWHITLGTWFREYVYIPLGGNRKGKSKQIRNILIVWLLTGIWHGASWNFLAWGAYYACFLILEKIWLLPKLEKLPKVVAHFYTLFVVLIGWVIFAFDSLKDGFSYIGWMVGRGNIDFMNTQTLYLMLNYGLLLCILVFASTNLPQKGMAFLMNQLKNETLRTIVETLGYLFIFLCSVAYLVDATYNPFLYFRF
ncbi:MAG: MBOAT family O-acyltransferase [Acetivibrio sp.]